MAREQGCVFQLVGVGGLAESVVAKDLDDGQLYRYTGGWESTRKKDVTAPAIQAELKRNPGFDLNIYDFKLQKAPAGTCPEFCV